MPTRRDFLAASATLAAGLGCMSVSGNAFAQPASAMLSRKIPASGEALAVIGAGTSGSFEVDTDTAQFQQLKQVLKVFFAGGGQVIDTSPNYGGADAVLGQLLEEGAGASRPSWRPRSPLTATLRRRRNGRAPCAACAPTRLSCCRCTTCVIGNASCPMPVSSRRKG